MTELEQNVSDAKEYSHKTNSQALNAWKVYMLLEISSIRLREEMLKKICELLSEARLARWVYMTLKKFCKKIKEDESCVRM